MVKLKIANKDDLGTVAQYMSKVNAVLHMRSAYIETDEREILDYLEEIYMENPKAILFLEEGTEIIGAVAGDICCDNQTIEVIGPFISPHICNGEKYGQDMIEAMKALAPGYRLQFFIDIKNMFIDQLILRNNGKKTTQHCNMVLELQDWYKEDNINKVPNNCIKYTNGADEEKIIKHQIEELHDKLFPRSYYNGSTMMDMLDNNHIISYCVEEARVVSYASYNTEDEGYLDFLGTNPMDRCKGYGSSLLQQVFSIVKSKQCKKIKLCVGGENHNAIRVYEKLGFKVTERNQAYILE